MNWEATGAVGEILGAVAVLLTAGGRWFWENFRHEFEESFRSEIDEVLSETESSGTAGRVP